MGNCFRKILSDDYNYDILDREVDYTAPSAPPQIMAVPELPQSESLKTVYHSAHSDLSTSFKESLVKADELIEKSIA